ncbi:Di-copper centre-containing protein [Periconia macrospinosa]|uniref:tyrosinase n=1 Tax=Periconia macrospinosa TaxID=97972 RepID=A0A2V1DQK9_9PLEO|nr:Di-copper centre-containing protein [Periconia macrospinosa]
MVAFALQEQKQHIIFLEHANATILAEGISISKICVAIHVNFHVDLASFLGTGLTATMKTSTLSVASLLVANSYGSPFLSSDVSVNSQNFRSFVKRQGPGSYYAITGAKGGVQPRIEIRELEKAGGEMWNLFLLAIAEFKAMDQDIIDSYYQIAGIHGMPWENWDGVEGLNPSPNSGYCPHNQLLFGIWHRPFLILFEQKLQEVATKIADTFPTATRTKYQEAASKLRIPFWDWAKAIPTDQPILPNSISNETATVSFPNGTTASIDNPLYEYRFHPLDHSQINGTGCTLGAGPSGGLPQVCDNSLMTVRADVSASNYGNLEGNLRRGHASRRTSLYNLLSQPQTFTQMTSADACDGVSRVGNIEAIHNPIHNAFFPGHMSPASVSAYDPVFWLHHANVDRQIALWQTIFPETYLGSCAAGLGTWTIESGQLLDAESPLTPFHRNAQGDFWTATTSRNFTNMGYTYPELVDNPSNATIVAAIKTQYSGPPDVPVENSRARTQTSSPSKKELFLAQVKLPSYGLDDGRAGSAPYNVLLSLGKSSNSAEDIVGIASALGNANSKNDKITTVPIDLSSALDKAIASGATTADKAQEYLKTNLHYRLELGGEEIAKEKLPALKVSLVSIEVEVAQSDDTFDRWVGDFKEHGTI